MKVRPLPNAGVSIVTAAGSYGPEVVAALVVEALQGAVPPDDGQRSRNVPQPPQDHRVGPVRHLQTRVCRHARTRTRTHTHVQ